MTYCQCSDRQYDHWALEYHKSWLIVRRRRTKSARKLNDTVDAPDSNHCCRYDESCSITLIMGFLDVESGTYASSTDQKQTFGTASKSAIR